MYDSKKMSENRQILENKIRDNLKSVTEKIPLSQKDFMYGTYQITKPGYYYLTENIYFNPNCPCLYNDCLLDNETENLDWMPTQKQLEKGQYTHSSFILGFYAAITVEVDNVIIDLNSHTIEQHPLHYLQQRFFQVIQLNNSPFIVGQGPSGTFSDSGFQATKNIIIKNGIIGRTSHYAIHGNDNENIILENLIIKNFEAGGVALNNVDNIVFKNVLIHNSQQNVPVLGNYSALRNTKHVLKKCDTHLLENNFFNGISALDIFKKLLILENRIVNNYINNNYDSISNFYLNDEIETEIKEVFLNKSGLPDGSVITGIQITPRGIAIHAFQKNNDILNPCSIHSEGNNLQTQQMKIKSSNIYLYRVKISNLKIKTKEIIHCEYQNKKIVGSFGDTVNMLRIMDKDGYYKSNVLNDCCCCLAKILKNNDIQLITTLNIPDWFMEWSESKEKFGKYKKDIKFIFGTDIMAHVNKGILGLRIGGTYNINLQNIKIQNIYNNGPQSLESDFFIYQQRKNEIHNLQQETNNSYGGILAIGLLFADCSNIYGNNIQIQNIKSQHKQEYDILYNDSEHMKYLDY